MVRFRNISVRVYLPVLSGLMSFISFAFLFLFVLVFASRLLLGRTKTEPAYLIFLLLASIIFYGWHTPMYLLIILVSTVIDYRAAIEIHNCGQRLDGESAAAEIIKLQRQRKQCLLVSLVANLGMLAFFKYTDFALTEVSAGLSVSLPKLRLILPMGISFYTFQSMSYTIDVYRGHIKPLDTFWKFFLYVSFFPQLVAGPIVRASEFLYQLDRRRQLHLKAFNQGGYLVLRGLFLKVVCADNIGRYVDVHWQDAWGTNPNSSALLLASVLFAFQIFGDFAGYSSIARGLAYWLGFRFPKNFNSPYLATSFSNFWQRWHITLSEWLRDYLYVPLGGNRCGPIRTYVNLMFVMVLGGLWHGASLTFVVWGILHGVALAIERRLGVNRMTSTSPAIARFAWFVTVQAVVLLTWIVFRSQTLEEAGLVLSGIFAVNFAALKFDAVLPVLCALPIVAAHLRGFMAERGAAVPGRRWVLNRLHDIHPFEQAIVAAVMLVGILTCYAQSSDFMYFQF